MSSFSDTLEVAILNSTLRGVDFNKSAAVYVALFTADPTDANTTSNECSTTATGWTNYVRKNSVIAAEGLAGAWTAPADGAAGAKTSSNVNTITFPANNGVPSVIVTHMGLYDAASGGNLLYHNALVAPKTLLTNDELAFGTGSISVSLQ